MGVITFPYVGKNIIGEWKEGKEWKTKHRKKDGTLLVKFENGEWIVSWEVLFYRGGFRGFVWKSFGDKDTQPKYKGQVENGKPNGQATYTFTDGRQNIGEHKNDKVWNVKHYNTYGKYIGSWVNGVWQN